LQTSTWHLQVQCTECHAVPASIGDPLVPTHMNGTDDLIWGPLAKAGTFDTTAFTCTGVYCHGATLKADAAGQTSNRTPKWITVDGSQIVCGKSCHTTPPGGGHPGGDACPTCHGQVIATFTPGNPPTATWANASLHVNGIVEKVGSALSCTSCHGNAATGDPSPPLGTKGETLSSQAAVGAHQEHLAASNWHRNGQCTDCHVVPTSTLHSNGQYDMSYAGPTATGANPSFNVATLTCTGVYCHGATLAGPKSGGTVAKSPIWNVVNGTWDGCGTTCHTNPPGGTHVAHQDCAICHKAVVTSFNPATNATTWTNAQLHINGVVEQNKYHDLANWTSPKGSGNPNHHGSHYFLTHQQRDEHNVLCSDCHGANLDGGTVGVSCNNTSCHAGQDWKSCSFCHGTPPSQNNPPLGVGDETTTSTLAVGRHVAHLTASATHVAFACASCHTVPAAGDVAHALEYVPSASLATTGHHGDVAFSAPYTAMTWNVNATQGAPVTARGTCVGSCHSNGDGGPPVVTPYWAGGTWTAGSCGNCHTAVPGTGQHNKHVNGEKLACTVCHNPANDATHMNGQKNVKSPINGPSGGSVTVTKNVCTNGGPRCNGSCHGHKHNNQCW
jgi:predicted CxxxxCH...CXXCH cytochrome family protein